MITNNLPTNIALATRTNDGLMSAEDKIKTDKIDRIEYDISLKANKTDKIKSSQLDISSNTNKIQPNNLSDSVKAMMTGTTPVSPTIGNGSLTMEKYADNSVTYAKRTPLGNVAVLASSEYCNFNIEGTDYAELTLPSTYTVIFGNKRKEFTFSSVLKIPKNVVSNITYNERDGIEIYSDTIKEYDYLLGVFDGDHVSLFNGSYLVNGSVWFNEQSISGESLKDFSVDSMKLSVSEGAILESVDEFINVDFKSSFVEIMKELKFDIGNKYYQILRKGTECFIPKNTTNSTLLYIYYNISYDQLVCTWSTADKNQELVESNSKLFLLSVILNTNTPVGVNKDYITISNNSFTKTIDYVLLDSRKELITINFATKKISLNDTLESIIDKNVVLAAKTQVIDLTDDIIADIISNGNRYVLVSVKRDIAFEDRIIKLVKLSDYNTCGNSVLRICDIYKLDIYGSNINSIRVIDKTGKPVKTQKDIKKGIMYPFDTSSVQLKISTSLVSGDFIAVTELLCTMVIDYTTNSSYTIKPQTNSITLQNPSGLYSILFNTEDLKVYLYPFDTSLVDQYKYLILGYINNTSDTGIYTVDGIVNNITVNGIRPSNYIPAAGANPDEDYDWENNRIILPSDLYLLKGQDYSINTQNINIVPYVDNDHISYELALPTKTIQSENSLNINSPISGDFESIIVGKYKGNNKAIFKNVKLHVFDHNTAVNKTPKILCIGDDTVDLNMPGYIKSYLSQFGVTATMLGTTVNTNSANGYGSVVPSEKGEGKTGWRLSDFMCHTKRNDDTSFYKTNNPFMNTTTHLFDFSYYMKNQNYTKVDMVYVCLGLNDITGYHTETSTENIQKLSIHQNLELMPVYYKEMIASIHKFDPNTKIIIDSTILMGIDDNYNKNSLLWAEALFYELKDLPNVILMGSFTSQGLFTGVDKSSISTYPSIGTINDSKYGYLVSNKNINGTVQSNRAFHVISTMINITK